MNQHGPGERQRPVLESFAAHPPAQEHVFDNANAPLGLAATLLQSLELPGRAPLTQLLRRARAHGIVNSVLGQTEPVGFIVESAVRRYGLEVRAVGFFHAPNA